MGIGDFRRLFGHRRKNARMLMSEAGDRRSARSVENSAAILGNQPPPFAADDLGRGFAQATMQHAAVADGHDHKPFSVTYWEVAARRASVSSRRFFATAPPIRNAAAASDCAIATAPVRLGKKPGEAADSNKSRWSAPSATGAVIVSAIAISRALARRASRADSTLARE